MKVVNKHLFSVDNLLNNEQDRHHRHFNLGGTSWGWIFNPSSSIWNSSSSSSGGAGGEKPLLCNESCCFANEVCSNSNLHGLKYVGNIPGHYFERIFFGIFFILGLSASIWLIIEALDKYDEFPTFVTFRENDVHIDHIPFPSVTICTINNVSKRKAMPVINDGLELKRRTGDVTGQTRKDLQFIDSTCETTTSSLTSKFVNEGENEDGGQDIEAEAENILDVLFPFIGDDTIPDAEYLPYTAFQLEQKIFDFTQSCGDMIRLCLWQNKQMNCSDLFVEVLTDYGKCCSWNMAPASLLFFDDKIVDSMTPDLVEQWKESDLDIEDLLLTSHDSKATIEWPQRVKRAGLYHGLSILLNPDIDDYFCPASDSLGFQLAAHLPIDFPKIADFGEAIAPNTENFIKIMPDVTTADDGIRSLSPKDRNCYFTGEYQLKYFAKYTLRNCLAECLSNVMYDTCNCTQFYMPKDENRDLCGHQGMQCVAEIDIDFVTYDWATVDYCPYCRPTCTDIKYEIEVTSRYIREDINVWAERMEDLYVRNDSQFSIVHVYFSEDATYPKIRKRLYGIVDIIANIGGILGLCLGFSILSAVELLYLLLVRVCGKSCIVTKMMMKRRLNNEYELHGHGHRNPPAAPGDGTRKMKRNMSRKIITTQPLPTKSYYGNTTVQPPNFSNVLPNYFLDEVAPRFATGNNLRYY